ncbi:MAG: hypothetical protein ACKO8N_12020 [Rubrivivax sp.]
MMTHFSRFLAVSAFVVSLLWAVSPARAQSEQDFTLVNGTEYDIEEVYVAPTTSKTWGKDILGDGVLDAGKSKKVKFRSGTTNCLYNMMVKWADGSSTEWTTNFNLCKINKITLLYNRATDVTTAVTE